MAKKFSDHELDMLRGKIDLALDKIEGTDDVEQKEIIRASLIDELYAAGLTVWGVLRLLNQAFGQRVNTFDEGSDHVA